MDSPGTPSRSPPSLRIRPVRSSSLSGNSNFRPGLITPTSPDKPLPLLPLQSLRHQIRSPATLSPPILEQDPFEEATPDAAIPEPIGPLLVTSSYTGLNESEVVKHSPAVMDRSSNLLNPAAAAGGGRIKQVREAKEMEKAVEDRARRMGSMAPPYEFLELIGKGSYGRVFKSRKIEDKSLVAVKVIDVDSQDYKLDPREKDQAIKDFVNEIHILQQVKDSRAKNVNTIHEAFAFHSQLWIVSDYCPGGSVNTLMKASPKPGLEEKYIVAISRELAVALKHVHEIGIIHRDVKAANVLITEDGQLQLCDFGVSGVLESNVAKRSTIIGTSFWMPPEMHDALATSETSAPLYGTEIDTWSFGCTVYELATGLPPNVRIVPEKLALFLKKAPRLEGGDYSTELREFIAFCLKEKPEERPTADQILKHPFVANTQKKYPTAILRDLVERYARWEQTGGIRHSLFNAHGAAGPGQLDEAENDDWNFSTTAAFDTMMFQNIQTPGATSPPDESQQITPKQQNTTSARIGAKNGTNALSAARAARASVKMGRLFNADEQAKPYDSSDTDSDLPLRPFNDNSEVRESVIDLDAAMDMDDNLVDLADAPTIRPKQSARFIYDDDDDDEDEKRESQYWEHATLTSKRKTQDWKFPVTMPAPATLEGSRPKTQDWTFPKMMPSSEPDLSLAPESHEEDDDAISPLLFAPTGGNLARGFRPQLRHMATEPLGQFNDNLHVAAGVSKRPLSPDRNSMIDLDAATVTTTTLPHSPSRPSTSGSLTEQATPFSSFASNFSSRTDPFEFAHEPSSAVEVSFPNGPQLLDVPHRASQHMHTQSEPNRLSDGTEDFAKTRGVHGRGNSLEVEHHTGGKGHIDDLREVEANEADTEEAAATEAEEDYGNGHDFQTQRRRPHIFDDLGISKRSPQHSVSYKESAKERLKPGSKHWKKSSREFHMRHQASVSSLSGSLRVARRPSAALTQQNVSQQPEPEYGLQTQRWVGSVTNANKPDYKDPYLHPLSRSQSFADDSTADDSDAFFSSTSSLRPKRDQQHDLSPTQHARDDSLESLTSRSRRIVGLEPGFAARSPRSHYRNESLATSTTFERESSVDDRGSVSRMRQGSRDDTDSSGDGKHATILFPDIRAPKMAVLDGNANPHEVESEVERLLSDFAGGLTAVRGILERFGEKKDNATALRKGSIGSIDGRSLAGE